MLPILLSVLLAPEAASANDHVLRELPLPTPANQNVCGLELANGWAKILDEDSGRVVWKNTEKSDYLTYLYEEMQAEADATGGWEGAAGTLRATQDVFGEPPFLAMAGDRLLRIVPALGHGFVLESRPLDDLSDARVVRLDARAPIYPVEGSPDGRFLVVSDENQLDLYLIDVATGRSVLNVPSLLGPEDIVGNAFRDSHVTFTADGRYLTVTEPYRVQLFDLAQSPPKLLQSHKHLPTGHLPPDRNIPPLGLRGAMFYLPALDQFLSFFHYHYPHVIDYRAKQKRKIEPPWSGPRLSVGLVDPTGNFGFAIHESVGIDVFRVSDGTNVRQLSLRQEIMQLAISPSGRYLAFNTTNNEGVGVFDLSSPSEVPMVHIDISSGPRPALRFNGDHELICGDFDMEIVYAFTLP